VIRCEGT